jgi:hypothetical protein
LHALERATAGSYNPTKFSEVWAVTSRNSFYRILTTSVALGARLKAKSSSQAPIYVPGWSREGKLATVNFREFHFFPRTPVNNAGRCSRFRYAVRGHGRTRRLPDARCLVRTRRSRKRGADGRRDGRAAARSQGGPGARAGLRSQPRGGQEALRLDGLRDRLPARYPPQRRRGCGRGRRRERLILPPRRAGVGRAERASLRHRRPVRRPAERTGRPPARRGRLRGGCMPGHPARTAHRCVFADGPISGKTVLVSGGLGRWGASPFRSPSGEVRRW